MKEIQAEKGMEQSMSFIIYEEEAPMKFLKTTVLTAIKVVAAVAAAIQVLRSKDTSG